jgi:hypothetical protein
MNSYACSKGVGQFYTLEDGSYVQWESMNIKMKEMSKVKSVTNRVINKKNVKFNSGINILGSIPDYAAMMEYAVGSLRNDPNADFSFRTEKSGMRFISAINNEILSFRNKQHRKIIEAALSSNELRLDQKLLVVFWQLCINNNLFSLVTENCYMKSLFAGRLSLYSDEILSYLYELRRTYPDELQWSDATLKITASKYLTLMKKLGLATGSQTKEIKYPVIGDEVFEIMVRLALTIFPDSPSEQNPLFGFSFLDNNTLINKFKSIKYSEKWTISQLGNNIKITLNSNE